MKAKRAFLACGMAVIVAFSLCVPAVAQAATKVTLKAGATKSVTLYQNISAKKKVTLVAKGQKAANGTWKSSNKKVATVKLGKVTAKKAGRATITVTYGKKAYKAKVVVKKVALNKTKAALTVGDSATLKLTGDTIKKVSSGNKAVVTAKKKSGTKVVITGKGVGTASVTVVCKAGKKLTCKVTVAPIPVTSVSFGKTSLVVKRGESAANPATVKPDNATEQGITYTSSDKAVATVDASGTVKGIGYGRATITATTVDGKKTATCAVGVLNVTSSELKGILNNMKSDEVYQAIQDTSKNESSNLESYVSAVIQASGASVDTASTLEVLEAMGVTDETLAESGYNPADVTKAQIETMRRLALASLK